ncbi:hypothetical protein B0P06_006034 [Clostridium saccharoperbutylacetonicum]|uniref:Tail sheath subunit n=2 Tax=Clostridium TaxID=1485 RepID=M1MNZ2_9CLOT|nr:hypothetical protein [Clostridium saccharoperbutylacetonicum]AGF59584.1 tail sheath subunit [Clostridium saccharoperbutylacetonicum N1-4(HMT)]NRT64559.1 hypothetical protein [Clostridium saccharoperbutylacetonicum]NSB29035.1 hypothetical protein [Clostridium saccharoperbutylacetonicum]NSB46141.1 hypothetical protein [Clostridium saccharoperbutylacetonicum]
MATSLGNLYPNLPGMLIEFKDGGSALRFEKTDASTDSLLLLGTAVDGPIMEPVAVDYKSAELIFGSDTDSNNVPNGATLVHAFKQAYEAGCRDIRLMRISGSKASTVIQTTSDSVTNTKRIDENEIAYISGNDATEISLPITAGTAYDKTSLEVYAKGRKVDATAYTLDDANKKLKLNANACDAGASLEVKYKEVKTNANTETVTVEALSSIKNGVVLSNNADKIVSVAKADASSVTLYNLDGDKTTIIISDTSVKVGDAITVQYESYTYARHDVRATAATSLQVVALKNTAATGSEPVLYIDNAKVLDPSAYSFDAATNTIKIIKENFKMNQTISVSYFVQTTASVNSSIKIQSIFGGEIYNEGIVEVKDLINSDGSVMGKKVIITKPESKQTLSEAPQVYTSIDYPTFGLLAEAITANNNIYEAYTEDENELTANLVASSSYLSNGEDGTDLTADELFEALSGKRDGNGFILAQGAYQILENYQVDQIVPVGVYADDKLSDKNANFAYELALYCAISSYRNKTTIGAIPMKPIKDTTLANIQKYAKYLATYDNTYYMLDEAGSPIKDSEGNKFDLGKYISVVAGPKVLFNHSVNALREGNAAVMYMAYTSTLASKSAPTNKKMLGTTGLKFNFSNSQLNDIIGNRMVAFQLKYLESGNASTGAYVVDAPTAAAKNSDYARLSTVRVIRDVADAMREVADPYIGEANTIEKRNALSAAIAKRLDLLVQNGVIQKYSYSLVATAKQEVLGEASLELGIVPPQELRKITTVIGLTSSQA